RVLTTVLQQPEAVIDLLVDRFRRDDADDAAHAPMDSPVAHSYPGRVRLSLCRGGASGWRVRRWRDDGAAAPLRRRAATRLRRCLLRQEPRCRSRRVPGPAAPSV